MWGGGGREWGEGGGHGWVGKVVVVVVCVAVRGYLVRVLVLYRTGWHVLTKTNGKLPT